MSDEAPNIRLELDNRPENVWLVREMLTGLLGALAIDRESLDDIKTAVSEACDNVVLHAYDGGRGPLGVHVFVPSGEIAVVVRDRGSGIHPRQASDERVQGIGLAVIHALSERVEFSRAPAAGTQVRMVFRRAGNGNLAGSLAPNPDPPDETRRPAGEVSVSVAPVLLLAGVLGRMTGAVAARAHFSLDRLSDAQLVTDALAARVSALISRDVVDFSLTSSDRRVDLSIGPLRAGSGERLRSTGATAGLEPALTKLVDESSSEAVADGEMLHLAMVDRR